MVALHTGGGKNNSGEGRAPHEGCEVRRLVIGPFESPLRALKAGMVLRHVRYWGEVDLHAQDNVPAIMQTLGLTRAELNAALDDLARGDLVRFALRKWGTIFVVPAPSLHTAVWPGG
jgi:hypothetical protein